MITGRHNTRRVITSNQVSDIQNSGPRSTAASESAIIADLNRGKLHRDCQRLNNTTGVAWLRYTIWINSRIDGGVIQV